MGNLKGRVKRLEGGRKGSGFHIIIVHPGETREKALQKHLAQHPADEDRMIFDLSEAGQDSPSAPPPSRQEPKYSAQAPGPGPLQITR